MDTLRLQGLLGTLWGEFLVIYGGDFSDPLGDCLSEALGAKSSSPEAL